MFSLGFVCPSVCPSVCEQDNTNTYGRIFIKFSGCVRNGKRKKGLDFVSGSNHYGYSGSMKFNF